MFSMSSNCTVQHLPVKEESDTSKLNIMSKEIQITFNEREVSKETQGNAIQLNVYKGKIALNINIMSIEGNTQNVN